MDSIPLESRFDPSSSLASNASKMKYKPFNCFSNYCKELKSRSLNLPSILLLIYTLPMTVRYSSFEIFFRHFSHNPSYNQDGSIQSGNVTGFHVVGVILGNATFLLAPVCGWLSDTKIGRSNAIYLSLWLGWIGNLLFAIGSCLQYQSDDNTALITGGYVFIGIALVFTLLSVSLLFTNILPYGIDQLMNESSVKIRAFIHWYMLCLFIGYVFTVVLNELSVSVVSFALFSFSLCLHFFFKHRFEHIPIPNPYKIVFKVLKFSLKTSRTRRQHRSAFTYWGEEPSRMDLAKERYGGCFSHEEVENVKTFLRIAVVLITLFFLFVSSVPFFNSSFYFVAQFKNGFNLNAANAVWFLSNIIPYFVLVFLFELVILPLFPKLEYFITNPLKALGLANLLIILSIVSLFLIDLIGRISNNISTMPCFFIWEPVTETIQISYWIVLIPSVLAGTSFLLSYTCTTEFICSQSPFGMHGMIIGLFWFLHGVFMDIGGCILLIVYYYPIPSVSFMSCTSWFTVMFCIITIIGLMVYILIARWYVNRVRDTDLGLRAAVEEHWENRLMTGIVDDTEALEDYIICSID